MHIRRSVLSFLSFFGGVLIFSLSLLLWSRSRYAPVFLKHTQAVSHEVGGTQDVDHFFPEPQPGDDTLRKSPAHDIDEVAADIGWTRPIDVSSPVLHDRLQLLLEAPVLSHSMATIQNEKSCPRSVADKQVNPDQLQGNREKWLAVSETDIRGRREAIVRYLEKLEKEGTAIMGVEGKETGEGRGVVMTAGNKNTAQSAVVTIRMLRLEYKSVLPVQVFSFPGELTDQELIDEMRVLGATHHELIGLETVAGAWKNFHLKAASILSSTFAEVLYLDSDNVPLRDPAYLFDEKAYKDSGRAVFWPDFNKDHPDNAIWRILGKSCDYTEWEVESGQILIDKRGNNGLNLAALHIAAHMQADHDFWFTISGGDKDTYRYAFWALGIPYLAAPRWLSALGSSYGDAMQWQQGKFCGYVMLQYDIAKDERGQLLPLFLHANLLKHRSGPVSKTRLFQTIKRASQDDAIEPSLDRARMWVYQDGGMCADLEVEAATDNRVGPGQEQRLLTEEFAEVYGGVFKDFENQFLKHSGKVGGW